MTGYTNFTWSRMWWYIPGGILSAFMDYVRARLYDDFEKAGIKLLVELRWIMRAYKSLQQWETRLITCSQLFRAFQSFRPWSLRPKYVGYWWKSWWNKIFINRYLKLKEILVKICLLQEYIKEKWTFGYYVCWLLLDYHGTMKAHCTAYEKKILTKEKYILTKTKIRERKSIRVMVQSPNHDLVTEEGSSGENLLGTTYSLPQLFWRSQST